MVVTGIQSCSAVLAKLDRCMVVIGVQSCSAVLAKLDRCMVVIGIQSLLVWAFRSSVNSRRHTRSRRPVDWSTDSHSWWRHLWRR